jgi:putative addiction module component (TIGR02574 family)
MIMEITTSNFRTLSVAERIQLVEDIWDSIATDASESVDLTIAQREEVRRRVAAHDTDPSSAVPWDTVRAELFQRNY